MELKIKIKEVKEESRKLNVEEYAVFLVSENGGTKDSVYQHAARDIVKSWGLVGFVNGLIALFRTETIRDATEIETIAWHCTQIFELCDMIGDECYDNCPKRVRCDASLDYTESMAILKGKEVILELV